MRGTLTIGTHQWTLSDLELGFFRCASATAGFELVGKTTESHGPPGLALYGIEVHGTVTPAPRHASDSRGQAARRDA